MNILGIVTEYNPFHNGHSIHIKKSKLITDADYVIAVMSGNFVQRGEPALTDKWSRAKMALSDGADIVIELPTVYSTASAEYFSRAAIKLLNDTGIVSSICFGSECGDIEKLSKVSDIIHFETEEFRELLKSALSEGLTFPVARANAVNKILSNSDNLLSSPNNILGIEYLKTLKSLKSKIKPFTISREMSDYNSIEMNGNIVSASAIRNAVSSGSYNKLKSVMPKNCYDILFKNIEKGISPIALNDFSHVLNYRLRSMDIKEISEISDITEGLENRILKSLDSCYSVNDIADYSKSKRYTYTKIQRALLHIILDIKSDDLDHFNNMGCSQYIRVLGFKKSSENILSLMCEKSSVPVITNIKKSETHLGSGALKMLNIDKKSTDLYFMVSPSSEQKQRNKDYTTPIVIV